MVSELLSRYNDKEFGAAYIQNTSHRLNWHKRIYLNGQGGGGGHLVNDYVIHNRMIIEIVQVHTFLAIGLKGRKGMETVITELLH